MGIMPELSETFKRLERDPQEGSQHLIELLESFLLPFLLVLDQAPGAHVAAMPGGDHAFAE